MRTRPPRTRREGGGELPPLPRTAVATLDEQFYVLRTSARTGARHWDGPFTSQERAESELSMLIDRDRAFITKTI